MSEDLSSVIRVSSTMMDAVIRYCQENQMQYRYAFNQETMAHIFCVNDNDAKLIEREFGTNYIFPYLVEERMFND